MCKQIARNKKEYNQKTLPALEAEIACLKKFLTEYKTKSSGSVYEKLSALRRERIFSGQEFNYHNGDLKEATLLKNAQRNY